MRKIILAAFIAAYVALKTFCTGHFDPVTDLFMAGLISGVWFMVCTCIDECKPKNTTFTDAMDGLYSGQGPDYIDFKSIY